MQVITKIYFLITFLILFIPSCTFGPRPDNTKPMYGEVEMDYRYVAINNDFIKRSIDDYNSIDNAARNYLGMAWAYYAKKDFSTAMKRFNQVWLLNPELPNVYFGFAALLETQNNKSESERFYKIAFEKCNDNKQAEDCLILLPIYPEMMRLV